MMIQLTHPEPNYEFWIDAMEITVMERYTKPNSIIIQANDDRPNVTALVLKSGKIMSCKETPAQIMGIIKVNMP
jgi:hypothetical protein